jgi:hypothetical protein
LLQLLQIVPLAEARFQKKLSSSNRRGPNLAKTCPHEEIAASYDVSGPPSGRHQPAALGGRC